MKIVKKENAKHFKYADTSSVLEYSIDLNEKNMDFCINTITGRSFNLSNSSKLIFLNSIKTPLLINLFLQMLCLALFLYHP